VRGTTTTDLVVEDDWDVVTGGERGKGEEIIGGYTWSAMEEN